MITTGRHFRSWPLTDIETAPRHVSFKGQSGRRVEVPRMSPSDPKRSFGTTNTINGARFISAVPIAAPRADSQGPSHAYEHEALLRREIESGRRLPFAGVSCKPSR